MEAAGHAFRSPVWVSWYFANQKRHALRAVLALAANASLRGGIRPGYLRGLV